MNLFGLNIDKTLVIALPGIAFTYTMIAAN
jgi:hypothetical protein